MLTKPRPTAKPVGTSMYSSKKGGRSPLILIGVGVTLVLTFIGIGAFVVLPKFGGSHAAAVNMDCTLIIPNNPLSAQGLATPYQLTATNPANGACNEANANQSAFVQAAILDPATGKISVYNPLVIDQGTQPAIAPTAPQLPPNAVVGIWYGSNGNALTLLRQNAAQAANQNNAANQANNAQGNNTANQANNAQGNNTANQANNAQGNNTANQANNAQGNNTANQANNAQGNNATQGNHAHGKHNAKGANQNNVANQANNAQAANQNNAATPANTATQGNAIAQGAGAAQINATQKVHMRLMGAQGMNNGNCVNGVANSVFGQFSYCNAPRFFAAANAAIRAGKLTIPALGTGTDGQACPTTRSFSVVDMDQSDNVQTQYLVNANGQTAQLTAANQAQLAGATTLGNPSDNALVTRFLDPALGCQPLQAPDLANNNAPVSALALNELQAAATQQAPIALVPAGDPMVLNNAKPDLNKINAYRRGVDQTPAATLNDANTTTYCQNLVQVALPRLQLDMTLFQNQASPDKGATANSLFTFLANRLNATLGANGLNCVGLLNIQNPVALTTDGNGVVTAATITTTPVAANGGTTGAGTGTGAGGVQQVATGTATINLDTNAGNAPVALNITYPNHPNQQINVNIVTDSCTGTSVLQQPENTDAAGANNANTVINGLQGLTALPNNWFFTVTDPQQNNAVVGCGLVVANGTTGTATLGTVANNGGNAQATPAANGTQVTPVANGTQATPAANGTQVTPVANGTQATPAATTQTTPDATQATPAAGNQGNQQGNTTGFKKHKHGTGQNQAGQNQTGQNQDPNATNPTTLVTPTPNQ